MKPNFTFKEMNKIHQPEILLNTILKNFSEVVPSEFAEKIGHTPKDILKILKSDNFYGLFIIEVNTRKIIGYMIGEKQTIQDGRYIYFINYLHVSKEYRSKGLGSYLLKLIYKKCNEWGVNFILLRYDYTNKKTHNFYYKNGFIADPILGKNERFKILCLYL